jgi:hypothetical protein
MENRVREFQPFGRHYPRVGKPTRLSLEFADDAETDTGEGL